MAAVAAGVMAPSRLETNFRRLLSQCNNVVTEGKLNDWRLEKYVESLELMLGDLRKESSRPNNEVLNDFGRQVDFLKGLIHANTLSSSSEKAMASQLLTPGLTSTTSARNITKEIHLKTTEKYNIEMRKELFGNDGLRHRTSSDAMIDGDGDYDAVLKYHGNLQEKIAEEMVTLARNLKENSLLAGTIIRKDTETIDKTSKIAEQNYDHLKVESSRLELHANKGCNWWIWSLLLVVCAVFVFMVFFMKIFKKS